jgi:predicted site-specific integrase-resolvase
MKTQEVMRILRISRPTVYNYRKQEKLLGKLLPNGSWDYTEDSVYAILNENVKRKTYLYARVSTPKQKRDLENQIELLKNWAFSNGFQIDGIFSDIASGISFDKRKDFFTMLDDILEKKVEKVIITYKDRLSRVGFELFSHLFKAFGTKIEVISEIGNPKLDSEEVFEEIVSLLHCFAMKLYSKRKKAVIQQLIDQTNGDEE